MDLISSPWPWYVAGPLISVVMISLLLFGKTFGLSSNLRTLCAACGAGKKVDFFNFDWKKNSWNLVFLLGLVIGGYISHEFMQNEQPIAIAEETVAKLATYDMVISSDEVVPTSIFNWDNLFTLQGFIFIILGGFLVGFGTRYAGGCTSGHAISGLSNLQKASLLATISFFAGGLLITHFVLPYLLNL